MTSANLKLCGDNDESRSESGGELTQGYMGPAPHDSGERSGDYAVAGCGDGRRSQAADGVEEPNEEVEPGGGIRSTATQLVDLALERYEFGVTPDDVPYARQKGGGHIVKMLRGGKRGLRNELALAFNERTSKAASSSALGDALMILEGRAAQATPVDVHLRVAEHQDAVYIDVGDKEESVVRVDAAGWSVVRHEVPVLFRRTRLTTSFPMPQRDGDLADMCRVLNLVEEDRVLVIAFMVAALIQPDVPHPILALFAEQGAGKSSAMRRIVDLTDPSAVPLRSAPSSVDDWAVAAAGSLVVGLDNLSSISDKFSDCLCRASTGDGSVKRELFTDDELAILKFRRVVIINGIEVGALKGDLIERLLTVSMHRIDGAAKRSERDLNDDWSDMYPRVFGALLDLCVQVKAAMNDVNLETSPRMVDFATLLSAVDKVLGTDGLGLYLARSETLAQDSLSADPFLLRLRNAVGDGFVGTSAQLLNAVEKQIADASISIPRGWPRNAMEVTGRLKRNAPALRTLGWEIEHDEGKNKDGTLCWTIYPPSDDEPE